MKNEKQLEERQKGRSSHNIGFNKKYTTIAIYTLIILFIAAIFIFFLMNGDKYASVFDFITGILSPIFIGMLIAYILNPFLNFFENVVFISKSKRGLRKARKALFRAKLNFDSVRTRKDPVQKDVDSAREKLDSARSALAAAYEAVNKDKADKAAKLAKKAAKKKRRPSFHPEPAKDRSHPMRGVSLLCTYLIFLTVITLILWIVIPQCISSLLGLLRSLEGYIRTLPARVQDLINRNETVRDLYNFVDTQIDLKSWISGFVENATGLLSSLLSSLPDFAVSLFSSLASGVTNLILSIFLSIYFLASKEMLSRQIQRFCRAFLPRKGFSHLRHIVVEVDHKFGRFIAGKALDSTIIGLLALVAMMIMGMPYYQMLALIIGITNMIPFFGPFIGAFIGGFILLISDPSQLIPFLIMVLILQQLDGNVIGPQILGDSLGLSPVWIMIAIVIMSGLLGFFGMLFGVPLFATIYTLLKESIDRRLHKRKLAAEAALRKESEIPTSDAADEASDVESVAEDSAKD